MGGISKDETVRKERDAATGVERYTHTSNAGDLHPRSFIEATPATSRPTSSRPT